MLGHPALKTATVQEQFRLVQEGGGMVIHAHPFREESYIPEIRLYPGYVDGVEGINATHSNPKSTAHNDPAFDAKAVAYAKEHGLFLTAGSDIHSTDLFGGGMAFRRRMKSIQDLIYALRSGEDYVLTDGVVWYRKDGERM